MAAASVAAALLVGTVSVPYASADDDLKDKQRKVEKSIDHAHDELDHSSKRLVAATERLEAARSQLATARNELATARGRLAVAQERDAQMQAALAQAEAELAAAEADLVAGQQHMDDQADQVASTVSDIYMEGDPQLLAFSSLLESASTDDLTRQEEVRDVIVGRETRAFDELHAAKVLLEVHERQVEEARDVVAVKRQEAADNLVVKQQLESEAEAAKASVVSLVGERSSARSEASKARAADARQLRELEREAARIEERLRRLAAAALARARAKAAAQGRSVPSGGGNLMMPVGWRGHLALRLPHAPDLRLLGPARRHRLRRRLRAAHPRGRVRARRLVVLERRLRPAADRQPRGPQRGRCRDDLQPRRQLHRRRRRPGPARPGHRLRRRHRLVHRLPPPLHRDGQRPGRGPRQLVLMPRSRAQRGADEGIRSRDSTYT